MAMKKVLILAAMAAVSVACHNRSDEEVGAAPNQGDSTAVTHVIDSTRTGPPGEAGRPGNATVTGDSVGVDSAATSQARPNAGDSTLTATPQDTLGPRDTGAQDSTMVHDRTMVHDSTMVHGDSAMTNGTVPDTTARQ